MLGAGAGADVSSARSKENTMNNLLASGHQSLNIIRRDLEDLFDEFALPRHMRFEVARAFDQAPSPMWLWRELDQILEAFMSPPTLRRRVEFVFDRVLSQRGFGVHNQNFVSPFFASQWRGNEFVSPFFTSPFFTSQWRGNEFVSPFFTSPFFTSQWRGNDFNRFQNTFNFPFHPFQSRGGFGNEDFAPPLELVETQGEYVVRVDLPGVRETDLAINIAQDNVLVIRGERRDFGTTRNMDGGYGWNTFTRGNAGYVEHSEQNYGVFTRTVPLPRNISPAQIQALFRDGVLEVHIAKFDSFNTFNSFNIRNRRVPIGRDQSRATFGSSFGNTSWNGEQRLHVS
jgi:HSP20 family protein